MKNKGKEIRILILNEIEDECNQISDVFVKSELNFEIEIAKKQSEFLKKILRRAPDVIIAKSSDNYNPFDIYDDARKAAPFSYFILMHSNYSDEEKKGFMLSGIDYFLPLDYSEILEFVTVQGFNKKHLGKSLHESKQILIESNQRLRSIFNNDQNAVFIIGLKFEIIDFNPAAIKELGVKDQEVLYGADLTRYFDKADLKKLKSAHAAAFRGKKSTDEFTISLSKTNKKQVSINFVPINNEEGFPASVILICKDVTEAFLFRQKFRFSEDRLLALANNAPIGVYFTDAEGRYGYVNTKWTEYTGLSARESLGRGWMKCIHPDDLEFVKRDTVENKLNQPELIIDYRIIHPTEGVKWIRGRRSSYVCENGKLKGFIGTAANITSEKLHALETIAAQKRQNTLMSLANIAIWEIDISGENANTKWSENLFALLERDLTLGSPSNKEYLNTYVHPEDRDYVRSLIKNYVPGSISNDFYYRAITSSGKLKYLRSMVTSENDLEGKPIRVLGFIQDITTLRESQEGLKTSDEKFKYLFNHSPDAIYIEDLDGNILEVNEQACRVQEMKKEELVGKNIIDLAPAAIGEEIKKKFKAMAQGDISTLHSYSWSKNGKKIPVQIKQNHITYNMKPALLLHVRKLEP